VEEVKTYIFIVDSFLLRQMNGRPAELVKLIQDKENQSEEEIIKSLCGNKYDRVYYANIKSRTIKILQVLAIISTSKKGSLTKKNFKKSQKKYLIGHTFLTEGQRSEGIKLIKQAYDIAVEYDFSHLASELASILHHDHIYYNPNPRLANFYFQKVRKYLVNYTAEKEAEYYFYRIVAQMNRSTFPLRQLEEALDKITAQKGDSVKFKIYENCIKVYYHLYLGNYLEVISSCAYALECLNTRKGGHVAHYLFFLRNKALSQIAVNQHSQAIETLIQAEKYTGNKPYNKYLLQYYKTICAFHVGNYEEAYHLFQKNKRCKIEDIREQFVIVEAYLCFLSCTGHLQLDKTFRLGKYLNETFKAQQDKQGDNINILIAELLVYLVRNRGKLIDRIEAIRNYSYRHLKGQETRRARWFLKILCLLSHPTVNFHPEALDRKAKKYIELLNDHPARIGEGFAIEIIPYEKLLELVMVQLGRKAA